MNLLNLKILPIQKKPQNDPKMTPNWPLNDPLAFTKSLSWYYVYFFVIENSYIFLCIKIHDSNIGNQGFWGFSRIFKYPWNPNFWLLWSIIYIVTRICIWWHNVGFKKTPVLWWHFFPILEYTIFCNFWLLQKIVYLVT